VPTDWGDLDAFNRLDSESDRPVCVALSGGGDSLAALIHTCAWAKRAGRPVMALHVDHRLQAQSAAWADAAEAVATRWGAGFQRLDWTGDKPETGIPAAARAARHALMADAARSLGAGVIVTGHTADDQAENAVLGQGPLREWSASPAWPEGRGVFLLRPLLPSRRADLRRRLRGDGFTWIDDPANDDLRHPRARIRAEGMAKAATAAGPVPRPAVPPQFEEGLIVLPRSAEARALAFAAVCAGGGNRLPRSGGVDRLIQRLEAADRFASTLCGARIDAAEDIVVTREPGRSGLASASLSVGLVTVWDGRFELQTQEEGLTVKGLAGSAAKLPADEKAKLRRIDARARGSLPLVQRPDGSVFCPILAGHNAVRVRSLVRERFLSAYGTIESERQACDDLCMAN
jgi:tRNA(Ile)-lysidine synthase